MKRRIRCSKRKTRRGREERREKRGGGEGGRGRQLRGWCRRVARGRQGQFRPECAHEGHRRLRVGCWRGRMRTFRSECAHEVQGGRGWRIHGDGAKLMVSGQHRGLYSGGTLWIMYRFVHTRAPHTRTHTHARIHTSAHKHTQHSCGCLLNKQSLSTQTFANMHDPSTHTKMT